jgi:hypothetical protein
MQVPLTAVPQHSAWQAFVHCGRNIVMVLQQGMSGSVGLSAAAAHDGCAAVTITIAASPM